MRNPTLKTIITSIKLSLFLTFSIISCNKTVKSNADNLSINHIKNENIYLKAIHANNIEAKTILIVPREGCGGCISEASMFLAKNKNKLKSNVSIIFTGVGDYKLLKKQVGEPFINDSHVSIDAENYFLAPVIASSYPMLITFNGTDQIESVNQFNTSNEKQVSLLLDK